MGVMKPGTKRIFHCGRVHTLCLLLVLLLGQQFALQAQDFVFAQLAGSPINTTGWNLQGAARVGNSPGSTGDREVILTDPVNTTSGAIFFNTPINLSQCKKWIAEFEFRIFDGSVADGLAFCYLDVPPSGFVSGGGIGIPATANGLKVVLDTWRNCGTDQVPKVQIRWGTGYEECTNQPTRNNNDNALSFIRSATYNRCRIEYDEGVIRVLLNGTEYLTGIQNFNFTGFFGFTASTGGFNDRHSIRNVRIFTEMPPSLAAPAGEVSFCTGGAAQLGTTPTPGYLYQWNPITGLSASNIANPVVSLPNPGPADVEVTYIVQTAFADRPGCTSRDSVRVKVLANPAVFFSHDTTCTSNPVVNFVNNTTRNGQVQPDMTYVWDFGDPASGAANASTLVNPQHTFSNPGSFSIGLMATSAEGCVTAIGREINPFAAPPEADFRILGDSCSGYDITFLPEVEQQGSFPLTYTWQFGDGSTSTVPAPVHRYAAGGTYSARLEVSNPYCPPVAFGRTVAIRPSPEVVLGALPGNLCLNAPARDLPVANIGNGIAGTGTYQGPGVQNETFMPRQAGIGVHALQYVFAGTNGCSDTARWTQEVLALPTVSAGPDRVSLEATPVQLDGSVGAEVDSFAWQPPLHLSNPALLNPIANPPADQLYIITAMGQNGCSAADTMQVTVLPGLFIPNAFSPNGDGINDVWLIRNLDAYPRAEMRIFDRYGQIVFSATGYAQPWDGRSAAGVPLPAGVYYFILDPKSGASVRQGSVTILR